MGSDVASCDHTGAGEFANSLRDAGFVLQGADDAKPASSDIEAGKTGAMGAKPKKSISLPPQTSLRSTNLNSDKSARHADRPKSSFLSSLFA